MDRNKGQLFSGADTGVRASGARLACQEPLESAPPLPPPPAVGAPAQAARDPSRGESSQIPCFYTDLGKREG